MVLSGSINGRCVVDLTTKGESVTGTICGYPASEISFGSGGDTFSGDTSL